MPYPVENLLEGRGGAPLSVQKKDLVTQALSLMIENDFTQLPVVDEDDFPVGMITYESIVKGGRGEFYYAAGKIPHSVNSCGNFGFS